MEVLWDGDRVSQDRTWNQWKYYGMETEMEYPPGGGQSENITSRRTAYAGGKNNMTYSTHALSESYAKSMLKNVFTSSLMHSLLEHTRRDKKAFFKISRKWLFKISLVKRDFNNIRCNNKKFDVLLNFMGGMVFSWAFVFLSVHFNSYMIVHLSVKHQKLSFKFYQVLNQLSILTDLRL